MPTTRPVLGRTPLTEAAAQLGLSPDRLRNYVQRGLIPCIRVGARGWMYFDPADIGAFLASMRVSAFRGDGGTDGPAAA